MAELTSMTNIGKEMARKLASVGIDSSERSRTGIFKTETTVPTDLPGTPVRTGGCHPECGVSLPGR